MCIKNIDYLNIGLIIISLFVAVFFPFKLFLIAYALLGPLHYLTQINWLHDKNYYAKTKSIIWIFAGFAFLFSMPYLFNLHILSEYKENESVNMAIVFFWDNINILILLAFVVAASYVFTNKIIIRAIIIALGLGLAITLKSFYYYNIWMGLLVPTVIHVFVFTLLFMTYGALKNKSVPGYISVILMLIVPFVIIFIDINASSYVFSDFVKNTFLITGFQIIDAKIAGIFGLSDGAHFYFYEPIYIKLQIFIAFAYTYHYLNWFSKTSIIG